MNSLSNFKLFSFSVKEQDEKTLSRTQEYVVMPSTRGRSWLFPNNTELLTELTAKMFRHKTPYDAGYIYNGNHASPQFSTVRPDKKWS